MNLNQRIKLLSEIGKDFADICKNSSDNEFPGFEKIYHHNPWFTEEFVKFSLSEWSKQLTEENLKNWLKKYEIPDKTNDKIRLGLIMAGNIPLVGFHDLICGFITGVSISAKLSSKDKLLTEWLINKFYQKAPELKKHITYTEEKLTNYNTIIATGSNNTNRYFEYYFSGYPNILRKNRNSVAILTGNETREELEKLADDIFIYFGLGCRNVSKLFLPLNYDFNNMGKAFQKYLHLADHHKYANNLNYQYALIAMNQIEHVNFGNLLLIEKKELYSPVSVINFEYYPDLEYVKKNIYLNIENIQCVVSPKNISENTVSYGNSQKPDITDYADGIDTINFILNLQK